MKDVNVRKNKSYNSINITRVTDESLTKANELYQAQDDYPTIIKIKRKALLAVTADLDLTRDTFEVLGSKFTVLARDTINGTLVQSGNRKFYGFEGEDLRLNLAWDAINQKVPPYLGYIYN